MRTVGEVISAHRAEILEEWTQGAQRAPFARGLSADELLGNMPGYLTTLAGGEPRALQAALERHLSDRLRQGASLNDIQTELASLFGCLTRLLGEDGGLRAQLRRAARASARIFDEHLLEDQQDEKAHVRRLQRIAADRELAPQRALSKQLDAALAVVVDAMQAEGAVLVLFDGADGAPVVAAASGRARQQLAQRALAHARGQDPRRLGSAPLLSVALPAGGMTQGSLYIDLGAGGSSAPSVRRRLEDLGAVVAAYLENARLVASLRDEVQLASAQRAVEARFVATLVHDLRGPLGVVKLAAGRLAERNVEEAREPAGDILDAVARLEAMIADLVDAQTVRDGRPLALRVAPSELVGIAEACAAELGATFGPRFRVAADGPVEGIWSAELLRRAIWNLGANAAQFGRRGSMITLAVCHSDGGAAVTVHNEGVALSSDQLERLHGVNGRHGPPIGWGLGLRLVWACAEAHGGSILASSLHGLGTCFGLRLPYDARPYLVDEQRCATRKIRHARGGMPPVVTRS